MRCPAWTLATAVLTVLLLPSAARAAGLSYEQKTFTAAPQAQAAKKASCGNRHVVSGGVDTPLNPSAVRIAGLAPYDADGLSGDPDLESDDGFRATVENVTQKKRKFTVHAICSKGPFAYEGPIQPAASGWITTSGPCGGGGLTAVGGGVASAAPFNSSYVIGSNPNGGAWAVSFDTGFATVAYVTWRICKAGWTVNQAAKTRTLLLGDRPTLRSLSCDPGQRLVGGGATGSNYQMYLLESRPVDTGDANDTPDAWQATIHNARQDGETFTVYVLCRDPN